MLFRTLRYLFAFLIFLTSTFAFAIDYSSEPVHRTFQVEGRSVLRIKNPDGAVRVIARPGNEIIIHAVKEVRSAKDEQQAINEAEKVKIIMTQSGGRIEVQAEYPRIHFGFHIGGPQVTVKMEVSMPPESDLDAEVADGNLDVQNLNGALTLDTADGEVTVLNCAGEVSISSADGDVRAENLRGTLRVDNGDGRVNVDQFTGNLEARTADGKLALNGIFKSLHARAADGRMEIHALAGSETQQDWMLQSADGDIILHLPTTFSAKAELSTSDGNITTDIPIRMTGSLSSSRVNGVIGAGGKLLQIHTADGDISITGEPAQSPVQ